MSVDLPLQRPWLRTALIGCFGFWLLITVLHWSSSWHDLYYRDIAFTQVGGNAQVLMKSNQPICDFTDDIQLMLLRS
jgi:hypothetical protein